MNLRNKNWIKTLLNTAGIYHIIWGLSVILFPTFYFDLIQIPHPNYIELWQWMGLISGVFGIGFIIISANPMLHWPLIFVGFLLKTCSIIGFIIGYLKGHLIASVFNMNILNDLIWVIPFGIILYRVYLENYILDEEIIALNKDSIEENLSFYETNKGNNLYSDSYEQPILLIFLRHFGCTFCRETLFDLSTKQNEILKNGSKIVLVHMVNESEASEIIKKYGLSDIEHISDKEQLLYKSFQLRRGTIKQLLGLSVLIKGFKANYLKKVGIGGAQGDIYQMPGVFLIEKGKITKKQISNLASDVPNYESIMQCTTEN
jgi:peroxiredoxin